MTVRWIGIPWAEGGESFEDCDCYGLVRLWHRLELGNELPPIGPDGVVASLAPSRRRWTEIPLGRADVGDVPLFRMPDGVLHVGVIVEPGRMLHVPEGGVSRIEPLGRLWRPLLRRIYRWAP